IKREKQFEGQLLEQLQDHQLKRQVMQIQLCECHLIKKPHLFSHVHVAIQKELYHPKQYQVEFRKPNEANLVSFVQAGEGSVSEATE
ncbi:hypothetical protein GW17_00059048, partial [Ensete ventricosum]